MKTNCLAIAFCILASALFLSCNDRDETPVPDPLPEPAIPQGEGYWLPLDAYGWTVITPSDDTHTVYVSSAEGDDANDGLSAQSPKKTIKGANELIRDGYPDRMLLKRGDTFEDQLGNWKNGRSADEPLVMTYYGDSGPRPVIKIKDIFVNWGGRNRNYTAYIGLDFYGSYSDPNSPEYTGMDCQAAFRLVASSDPSTRSQNVLIEDCLFRYCGLVIQGYNEGQPIHNVVLRRNVVTYNWAANTMDSRDRRPSGIYAEKLKGLVIEENLFHHNGHMTQDPGKKAGANMFNHNIYLNYEMYDPILVRGNILSHASSHGMQLRSGGIAIMNAFVGNAIAANFGNAPTPRTNQQQQRNIFKDNVVTDGRVMIPDNTDFPRTGAVWGIDNIADKETPVFADNIVANVKDTRGKTSVQPYTNSTSPEKYGAGNNIAWNWGKASYNVPATDPGWSDPGRNADRFAVIRGLSDWDAWINLVCKRPLGLFPSNLSAYSYINYIREGFNMKPVEAPYRFQEE